MGVDLLRQIDPTLTGSGIPIAQPEADGGVGTPDFEVGPETVGQSVSFFQWISTNGPTAAPPPNIDGTESSHADSVALFMYGQTQGVAPGISHDDNYEADYFFSYLVAQPSTAITDNIVNQSFAFFPTTIEDQENLDSSYDDYTALYGTIFSSACIGLSGAGGEDVGPPGTAYNCIGVGLYGPVGSPIMGPTPDNGRSKPDIVAPNSAPSWTTAYVSGGAAVLLQAAKRGDGGANNIPAAEDWRTIKALLLNGALKPWNWSNTTNAPLDRSYGAGVENIFYSYLQLTNGLHSYSSSNTQLSGGSHPPDSSDPLPTLSGWDFESISTAPNIDTVNHYVFQSSAPSSFTATLDWERQFGQTSINQLVLFLYNATNQNLVTGSVSTVDNVQHIYVPNLSPGTYDLEVIKYGGVSQTVSSSETYALAYNFYHLTSPLMSSTLTTNGIVLTWPSSPTVFILQGTGNLLPPIVWTNVTAQQWITNNTVSVNLGPSGAAGFYRLVR